MEKLAKAKCFAKLTESGISESLQAYVSM